jgi:hypothetical protein
MRHALLPLVLLLVIAPRLVVADELQLPDPLTADGGTPVTTADQWQQQRRPEVRELFRTHMYGRAPVGRPADLAFDTVETAEGVMDGRATRKRIAITFSGPGGQGQINALLFVPAKAKQPVPCFLLICHRGLENIDPTRESKMPFWPAEMLIERGYAAATFHVSDVDPDRHDGFKNGVHGIFDPPDAPRSGDAWATIAAWGWGASRVLDYLETDSQIDATRVAVVGHSRGGKAALWCGAEDERFALTISNDSGCTGAALARRKQGETVKRINTSFPHWFCDNYNAFNDREDDLPVDQHMLVALMAPRLVYVASAQEDAWADPEGEFLSCVHASPVYRLFGRKGVSSSTFPPADQPLHDGHIGYHLRSGKHDLTEYDWRCYLDFADLQWDRK